MRLAVILAALLLVGCAAIPVTHGIPNWQRVQQPGPGEGGLYCGGLPDTNGWQVIQALGVKRVINLTTTPDPQIPGCLMLQFPMSNWQQEFGLVGSQIEEALRAMDTPGPVFVHCIHGMNRTRTVVAIWRMRHQSWTRQRAVNEANEFGWGSSFHALKKAVQ
jgi:hypothetical protein